MGHKSSKSRQGSVDDSPAAPAHRCATQRNSETPPRSTRPCQYFLAGNCRNGRKCKDLHTEGNVVAATPPQESSHETRQSSTTPSPNKAVKVRSEEQAILLAMLNSLKDSLKDAQTPQERSAIYAEMRRAAEQYKQEHDRIRSERRDREEGRQRSASQRDRPSPLRGVNFPTFLYDGGRFGHGREEGSEDRVECAICIATYDEGEEILVLPCLHWFHSKCAMQWLEKKTECPLCQHDIMQSLLHSS